MLVLWITIFLLGIAVSGMIRSQRTFAFNNADQQMNAIVREARSFAVTGKAQPDYTDYDNDDCYDSVANHDVGCTGAAAAVPDYVTPAHYGIYFDKTNNKMIVFADLHPGKTGNQVEGRFDDPGAVFGIGQYDPSNNNDIKIVEYDLDPALEFIFKPENSTTDGKYTVMYTPLFADTSFYDQTPGDAGETFFVYGIKEKRTDPIKRCSAIHPVSGVPEAAALMAETNAICNIL